MADALQALSRDLHALLDDLEPVQLAIGMEGKDAAFEHIERTVGADRSLSGMRRKVRLGAGFDLGQPVVLNLRPKGLIILADQGRKRTTVIRPRRRGGYKAVMTPQGPRASATSRPSKGTDLLDGLVRDLETRIPKAAERAVVELIERNL